MGWRFNFKKVRIFKYLIYHFSLNYRVLLRTWTFYPLWVKHPELQNLNISSSSLESKLEVSSRLWPLMSWKFHGKCSFFFFSVSSTWTPRDSWHHSRLSHAMSLCPSFAVCVPTFQIRISVRISPFRLSKQSFYFHIVLLWFYFSLFISAQGLLIRNAFRDTSGKDFNIPFSGTVTHLHNKHKFSIYILYEKEKLWSQSRWVLSKWGASVACLTDEYQAQFCAVSVGLFCVRHSCRDLRRPE